MERSEFRGIPTQSFACVAAGTSYRPDRGTLIRMPFRIVAQARLFLAMLVLSAAPTRAETPADLVSLPEPVGVARLVLPAGVTSAPLVVMLPDALGEDGRTEPYVDSLLARGIASLVLGLGEDLDATPSTVDPAASPAAVASALAWARAAGFGWEQIGLMGFGLGGRAALAAGAARPVAALYPGCTALPLPEAGPVLVLQGDDAGAGCSGLPARAGLTLRLLVGAGHAWDAPGAIWPSPGPVLPDPADPSARLRARADLNATLVAAEALADWFEKALLARQESAIR